MAPPAPDKPFQELYDRVDKTAKCRYCAHQRLLRHNHAVQWTITVLALAQLALPLAAVYGLAGKGNESLYGFAQVFLAVAVLAFSQRIEANNFAVRAERMLDCGKELGRLLLQIFPRREEQVGPEYNAMSAEYEKILAKYENHTAVDFRMMRLQKRTYYSLTSWDAIKAYLSYGFDFVGYGAVTLAVVAATAWLLSSGSPT